MTTIVCRICLRTGLKTKDIDENLISLHDEICDFHVFDYSILSFCSICEYKLRKFYNFTKRCQTAHTILQTKRAELRRRQIHDLYKLMPPDSIGLSTPKDKQVIFSYISEASVPPIQNQHIMVNVSDANPPLQATTVENNVKVLSDNNYDTSESKNPTNDENDTEFSVEQIGECKVEVDFLEWSDNKNALGDTEINNTDFNETEDKLESKNLVFLDISDNYLEDTELRNDSSNEIKTEIDRVIDCEESLPLNINKTKGMKSIKKDLKPNSKKQLDRNTKKQTTPKTKARQTIKKAIENAKKSKSISDFLTENGLTLRNRITVSKDVKFETAKLNLEVMALKLIDAGNLDLGEGVTMTRETFLKIMNVCDEEKIRRHGAFTKGQKYNETGKLKQFLRYLAIHYNPEYETVFNIQYLPTREMKLAEFRARKGYKEYLEAEFKCEMCYRWFESKAFLEHHSKWHDESRPYVCDICSMRFSTTHQISKHKNECHITLCRCKLCHLVSYSSSAMKNHFDSHKGVKYSCDVCFNEFKSKSAFNTHRLIHAEHCCQVCGYRCLTSVGLNVHMKSKHQDCPEGVSPPIKINTRRKPPRSTCNHEGCGAKFVTMSELRQHAAETGHTYTHTTYMRRKLSDSGSIIYKTCLICQERVPQTQVHALYRHHKEKHPNEPFRRVHAYSSGRLCEHCGKYFVGLHVFRDHLNMHTGERPYACKQCPKCFFTQSSLDQHRTRHEPRRHECDFCGKKFGSAANLLMHRRTHIGDRRFKCEICSKGFLHAGSLKEHIRGVHEQVRRVKKTTKKTK